MGKVRRYKKKLAKAASGTNDSAEHEDRNDYIEELVDGLLNHKRDDGKLSVCSVMKSIKFSDRDGSMQYKKDAKRYLKHAFLLKGIEKTQKSISKKKKISHKNDSKDDDDDDDNRREVNISNDKVLKWNIGNTHGSEHRKPPKKHRKGFQKKQNAQLAKDLKSFSKKIKKQLKNPTQNVIKIQ